MGQKAVTLTLQPNQPIGSHAPTIKAFLNSTEYINTLKRSLLDLLMV